MVSEGHREHLFLLLGLVWISSWGEIPSPNTDAIRYSRSRCSQYGTRWCILLSRTLQLNGTRSEEDTIFASIPFAVPWREPDSIRAMLKRQRFRLGLTVCYRLFNFPISSHQSTDCLHYRVKGTHGDEEMGLTSVI